MPRFSETRGVMLVTIREYSELTGKSRETIKRRLQSPDAYTELHFVRREGKLGAVRTLFIDPTTLELEATVDSLGGSHNPHKVSEGHPRRVTKVSEGQARDTATLTVKTPQSVKLTKVSEGHVSEGHLARINTHPDSRIPRTDKGRFRLQADQQALVISGLVNNPKPLPGCSTAP